MRQVHRFQRTTLVGAHGANRVPSFDRNAFQQPKTTVVDLRVSKRVLIHERYGLEFLAEAFNLANHPNATSVGSTAYSISTTDKTHPDTNEFVPYTAVPFRSVSAVNNSNFAYNVCQVQMAIRLQF